MWHDDCMMTVLVQTNHRETRGPIIGHHVAPRILSITASSKILWLGGIEPVTSVGVSDFEEAGEPSRLHVGA
jgi:hypothetical protein